VNAKLEAQRLVQTLSEMELIALQEMAAGRSVRQLAQRLAIDVAGAEEIRASMKAKLKVQQDAEAVRIALYAGL
jgi:DNA-binding CsgD family transcriptional regulator